jgi:hypothetical protein
VDNGIEEVDSLIALHFLGSHRRHSEDSGEEKLRFGESRPMRIAYFVVLLISSYETEAACEIEPGHYRPKLSTEATVLRNAFYVEQCMRAGGNLLDGTDPTLAGRLESPSEQVITESTARQYHFLAVELGVRIDPVLMFLVESDGSVGNVAVITSSGSEPYDTAVIDLCRRTRWKRPAKLDGVPVGVLYYMRYKFVDPS